MNEHTNISMPPVGVKILMEYEGKFYPVIRTTWGYKGKVTLPNNTEITIKGRKWKYH